MSTPFEILDSRGRPLRQNAYAAATHSAKRAARWYAPSTGPNSALTGSLQTLRDRSHAGWRNNPFLKAGIERLVSNEIGRGIKPRALTENEDFNRAADALWEEWCCESDADETLSFYGQQAQVVRARRTAGEVFIRFRPRRPEDGLSVPLQLQVLEADFCPADLNTMASNGNTVKAGIEFNGIGKRVAYWFYRRHPSEFDLARVALGDYVRVPADEVVHHFQPTRPGQVRGEPITIQSLLKSHTLDSYDDAELVRKETRAPFTGFLERSVFEQDFKYDPFTGALLKNDGGFPESEVEAGTILQGMPGEKLTLYGGDQGNEQYAAFMRQQLLAIMAGLGVPYEIATGDYTGVNDRLIRAILNEFHRAIEMDQDHLTIHQVCRRVRLRWLQTAVTARELDAPGFGDNPRPWRKAQWSPHEWPYVHPEQDISAATNAIDGGIESEIDWLMRRGRNPEQVARNRVKYEAMLRRMRQEEGLPEMSVAPQPRPSEPTEDEPDEEDSDE